MDALLQRGELRLRAAWSADAGMKKRTHSPEFRFAKTP
jgi:hypothetical protein